MGLPRFLLGGQRRCRLHGVALVRGAVPVRHGRQGRPLEQVEAMHRGFPNAHPFAAVCLTGPGVPDTKVVDHCPACRIAGQAWLESRQGTSHG